MNDPTTAAPPNPDAWSLHRLLEQAGLTPPEGADRPIGGLAFDSRRVEPGDLYLAMPGARTHGAKFTGTALAQGAVAVLTDAEGADVVRAELGAAAVVPVAIADDPRRAMAILAEVFHHHPSRRVPMFGVTGTNGKTTTVFLLEAALAALGRHVGTIGTLGFRLDGQPLSWTTSTVTTPEAPDLQELFDAMIGHGADTIAMEVSSHALALDRVAGTEFAVAGFTMLGRDHLDFHADLEDYFLAKASLFTSTAATGVGCRHAVVCIEDDWGRRLAGMVTDRPLTTVGRGAGADVRILSAVPHDYGQLVHLDLSGRDLQFLLPMPGDYNVTNAALAVAMVHAAGLDACSAAAGLRHAVVPGRMQRVALDPPAPQVVVDFAHTPQAVSEALTAVRTPGRRIAVLGAGGDRDVEKRPQMGRAAAEKADVVVVTDDNPRTEDPALIRAGVLDGTRGLPAEVHEVAGRRAAITRALELATARDVVLVLGKGHEQGQQLADRVVPFDDVTVAQEAWQQINAARTGAAGGGTG